MELVKQIQTWQIAEEEFFDNDIWLASDIGLQPDAIHGSYMLKFEKMSIDWLKYTAKRFIRLQASIKSFSTCLGYIRSLNYFNAYLTTLDVSFAANKINRALIVGFIQHLNERGLGSISRAITLMNLRTFHEIVIRENWLDWPERPVIFSSDLPKPPPFKPRNIPDDVLKQLKDHLDKLSLAVQRVIILLSETGRRVSEICTLAFDCLEQDSDGDWFLRVYERKLSRIRLIPVSEICVKVINDQQEFIRSLEKPEMSYLFPAMKRSKSPTISARRINEALNELAVENDIVDANGVIWQFSTHQFRHTIGTKMINTGVPQIMVQHYLGHESAEMTARYAHIHNETMKKAFTEYQEQTVVDITGSEASKDEHINAKWLKKNIMTQSLPNGLCALPLTQQRCPHANACLTCSNFRTSKRHLEQHKCQLQETKKVISHAQEQGWDRIVEMNTTVADNLTEIIDKLESSNDE